MIPLHQEEGWSCHFLLLLLHCFPPLPIFLLPFSSYAPFFSFFTCLILTAFRWILTILRTFCTGLYILSQIFKNNMTSLFLESNLYYLNFVCLISRTLRSCFVVATFSFLCIILPTSLKEQQRRSSS